MNPRRHPLFSEEGRQWLVREYLEKERSMRELAEERDTYPNMIRRAILYHAIERRDRGEVQKIVLKSGRGKHPTQGKKHRQSSREMASASVSRHYNQMTPQEQAEHSVKAKKAWEGIPEERKEEIRAAMKEGARKSMHEGSHLERELYSFLTEQGYRVQGHAEYLIAAEDMHIDLLLPDEKVAIEVDGPMHFLPIFGEEELARKVTADQKKDGLLTQAGYRLIRVRYTRKVSLARLAKLKASLLEAVRSDRDYVRLELV